jgi:hypothetical protein
MENKRLLKNEELTHFINAELPERKKEKYAK